LLEFVQRRIECALTHLEYVVGHLTHGVFPRKVYPKLESTSEMIADTP
jgi:hypothetical protein